MVETLDDIGLDVSRLGDLSLSFLLGSLVGEPPRGLGSADFLDFFVTGGKGGSDMPAIPANCANCGFLATIPWKVSGLKFKESKSGPRGGPPAWIESLRRAAKMPPGPRAEFLAEF